MAKDSEPPPDPDTQQQPQVPSTGVSTAPDGITTTSPPILGGGAGGSGASAAGGSGSQLAITKTTASGQPPSTMSLQQDAVQGILKSETGSGQQPSDPLMTIAPIVDTAPLGIGPQLGLVSFIGRNSVSEQRHHLQRGSEV